jgi:hypothetical protein
MNRDILAHGEYDLRRDKLNTLTPLSLIALLIDIPPPFGDSVSGIASGRVIRVTRHAQDLTLPLFPD